MIRAAIALLALTAAAPAVPQHGPNFDGMPPERYNGDFLYEHTIYTMDISRFCGPNEPGYITLACVATADNGQKYKIMPNPCALGDVDFYARLECHENAHLRGWSANHEM